MNFRNIFFLGQAKGGGVADPVGVWGSKRGGAGGRGSNGGGKELVGVWPFTDCFYWKEFF